LLEPFVNGILAGKCEEVLKTLPENSGRPYRNFPALRGSTVYGTDESRIPPDDYVDWFLPKAIEFKRVLKDTGSLILNINDKVVNGRQHLYVYELVVALSRGDWFQFCA